MRKLIVLLLTLCMVFGLMACAATEEPTTGTVKISLSEGSAVNGDIEVLIVKNDNSEFGTYLSADDEYSKTLNLEFGSYVIVGVKNINDSSVTYEIPEVPFEISKEVLHREIILNISKEVDNNENLDEDTADVDTEAGETTEDVQEPTAPEITEEEIEEPEVDTSVPDEETKEVEIGTVSPENTEPEIIPDEPKEPEKPEQIFTENVGDVWVTENVNIRKEPNLEAEILGVFKAGKKLTRIGVSADGWSKIDYDGQHVYCSSRYLTTVEPVQEDVYPMVYEDETAKITITKEWYGNAWAYIAHLEFTDFSRLGTSVANGAYSNGYETTSHAAKRLGAIFAVNGCYSAPKLNYVVVRDGVIWNRPESTLNLPAIYSKQNGLFSNAWDNSRPEELKGGKTIQELVDAGLMTVSFCFGPPMLIDGEVLAENNYDRAQRTFVGTNGNPGDLWVVVSDGRKNDGESSGLNYYQCGQLLKDKGCTFGICLDGGGSSTMVFQGKILNANGANERAVVDFLYFK